MTYEIVMSSYTPELKDKIYEKFEYAAREATGINGLENDPVVFEIPYKKDFLGCVVVQLFWGQLHIKYLMVSKEFRKQGFGRALMEHAFAFGRSQGCDFAFVETMSFQAPKFYQKLGFEIDYVRRGYDKDTSFYYLSKNLEKFERKV